MRCTLGVDVGTSSTKGVLAAEDGAILATVTRAHDVSRPHTGWVEMDARIWWDEFVSIARELIDGHPDAEITAVGDPACCSPMRPMNRCAPRSCTASTRAPAPRSHA